jgi:hypothetical protein
MGLYLVGNFAMQTTAAAVKVATGTSIKTLMQIKPGATQVAQIIEWGISFDGSTSATPGEVELIETGTVGGTSGTAFAAADFTKLDNEALLAGDPTTNMFSVGTGNSCFSPSAEGSITTVRNLDAPSLIAPTSQFVKQFPLGREPIIQPANYARIRVTFAATVNCYCYMILRV